MPYLKWAGGKSSLLGELVPHLLPETEHSIFYDAFCGAGTVSERMADYYDKIHMNDKTTDLVATHRCVMDWTEELIEKVEKLFDTRTTEEDYYWMRQRFNDKLLNPLYRCATFVYMNKVGFNGLCRYNNSGEYNVPYGKRKKMPRPPSSEIRAFSESLRGRVLISTRDFGNILRIAGEIDTVYCDPPYYPLSDTAKFTDYGAGGFSLDDQERLAIAARNCPAKVVISNHDLPAVRELYQGAEIIEVEAQGSISCKGDGRSVRKEIIAIFERGQKSLG